MPLLCKRLAWMAAIWAMSVGTLMLVSLGVKFCLNR